MYSFQDHLAAQHLDFIFFQHVQKKTTLHTGGLRHAAWIRWWYLHLQTLLSTYAEDPGTTEPGCTNDTE